MTAKRYKRCIPTYLHGARIITDSQAQHYFHRVRFNENSAVTEENMNSEGTENINSAS